MDGRESNCRRIWQWRRLIVIPSKPPLRREGIWVSRANHREFTSDEQTARLARFLSSRRQMIVPG